MSSPPRSRPALGTLRALLPFLRPYRRRVGLAVAALLLAATATLTVPLAFRQLIDLGFAVGDATGDGVDRAFAGLLLVSVVLAGATALRFYCVSWLGERVTADLREAVYRQVLKQDPSFFETLKTGEVLSRLTGDTTLIQSLVGTSVSLGLRNLLLFCGALAMLFVTSAGLAAAILGLLVAVILPILLFGRRVRRLSRDSQDRIADTSAMAGETLGAIQIVQAYASEAYEAGRFARATRGAFDTAVRRILARSVLTAMAIVLVFGAIVFVLWIGAHAVVQGRMTGGLLAQFILYAVIVAGAVGAIAEVFGDVQRAAGATERLLELLESRPAIAAPPSPVRLPGRAGRPGARIELDAVCFSYPSRPAERALDSVSLAVTPGETVAIVGPSGAGKTTLFQLLLRFHDPVSGIIRFDGIDLRELDPADLRASIGLVSQDSVVFSADVLENIRYGRLDASDEEVMTAARAARVDEFVERLPQRWHTYLGERGVRLSGGQRQRVAIARALLRDPPLLLLDEATSALDAESERAVQLALEQVTRGRTTIVIAHRLATVIGADRIVVLDRGRIVESGNHDSLMAAGGLYARLAAMQFEIA